MSGQETTINELMEFLQEEMFSKADGKMLEKRLDGKISQVHLELSGQLRMIEIDIKDIKERLTRLEKRTIEDADATAKDVLELRRRIEALENKVRELQPA